jgi:NAD(P)-dependent dehydrogenase (short-subunit alcohol dehydrogenase family)
LGIGIETARALALAGADVTLAVRHTDTGDRTALRIMGTTANRSVMSADSTSLTWSRITDPSGSKVGGSGVAAYALDPDNARRLWEISIAAVRVEVPTYEIGFSAR